MSGLRAFAVTAIAGERLTPEQVAEHDTDELLGLIGLLRGRGMELRAEGDGWYRVVDAEPVFRPMPTGWRDVSRDVAHVIVEEPEPIYLALAPAVVDTLDALTRRTGKSREQVIAAALRALAHG